MRVAISYRLLFVSLVCVAYAGCRQSNHYRDNGAVLGAVTGAVAGAAIGNNNGEGVAGAAIGTVAGALVGSAIGDGMDQDMAHATAAAEQRGLQQRATRAVTLEDVIYMTQSNLSDDVIINQIRQNGVVRAPKVDELITLREQGVSDAVIRTLQSAPAPSVSQVNVIHAPPPRPVIVKEHHYVVPRRPRYYRPHHHYHHPHHAKGVHWGISVSK